MLADLKPSGKYVQEDLHQVGGTPGVMKLLLRGRIAQRRLPDRHRQRRLPRTSQPLPLWLPISRFCDR